MLYRGVNSNVTTTLQFKTDAELIEQVEFLVRQGNLLVVDATAIKTYLNIGYRHVVINYNTVFEITEV